MTRIPDIIEEVFQIDPRFVDRLTQILNKYCNQEPLYNLPQLLQDLADHLGARAAICAQVDPNGCSVKRLFRPSSACQIVEGVLQHEDVQCSIRCLLNAEWLTCDTASYDFGTSGRGEVGQIDVFAVPTQVGAEFGCDRPHCFLLIDPAELACDAEDLDERLFQRGLVGVFLRAWWVMATAPRYSGRRSRALRRI